MTILTEEQFLKNVLTHEMTILKDEGIYRHIVFRKPGSSDMHFELITWPGYLCYVGDMGSYVFQRTEDMFRFFRMDKEQGKLSINPSYWGEKLQAISRHEGYKEYDPDKFREAIKEALDDMDADQELRDEVEEEVLEYADSGEVLAMQAAMDFEYEGNRIFSDFYEMFVKSFTHHYIWCCYALAWGIRKYDESKGATNAAER
jgi:hypothetical protein